MSASPRLIAGCCCGGEPGWAIALAASAAHGARRRAPSAEAGARVGLLVLAGAWFGRHAPGGDRRDPVASALGHAVTARGHRGEAGAADAQRPARLRVRLTAVSSGPAGTARSPSTSWSRSVVASRARVSAPRDRGRGRAARECSSAPPPGWTIASTTPSYLRRAGVHAVLRADSIMPTGRRRGGAAGFVDLLRGRAEAGVGAGLDPLARRARDEASCSGRTSAFRRRWSRASRPRGSPTCSRSPGRT